jgi:NAD(P)-dependent dehydrogenase (short-subunit alcohol dehydrogenase family)
MTGTDQWVAVITGGSQGTGAGLFAGYRRLGWAVVTNTRAIKPPEDPDVPAVEADISQPATADRITGDAPARFGRIDTLVNNAGVFVSKPFTGYTAEDHAPMVGVNPTGFFWLARRVIAEMLKRNGGHVVNISATQADDANSRAPSMPAALTKGGLPAATRSLAVGVRLSRHPGQRRLAGHHPAAGVTAGKLRRARRPAPPARARRPGQRHRGRHLVPGGIAVRHRRDPAPRRRPDRQSLGPWVQ